MLSTQSLSVWVQQYFAEVVKRIMKEITGWDRSRRVLLEKSGHARKFIAILDQTLAPENSVWLPREAFGSLRRKVESRRCLHRGIQTKGKGSGQTKWMSERRRCDAALQKHWVIPSFNVCLAGGECSNSWEFTLYMLLWYVPDVL